MTTSIDLLSKLIQNACVNDGTINSGYESKNVDTIETFFSNYSSSVQVERHAKVQNRDNLVVRLKGSDQYAPSLLLLGHVDVVPADANDRDFDRS